MISYKKMFHYFSFLLFIIFLVLFVAFENGYYETPTMRNNVLTKKKIMEFEKDVATGKKIDPSNYVVKEKDYSNPISNFGLNTSKLFGKHFKIIMDKMFNTMNDMAK